MADFSIVEYFAEHEGYRCGYCKSPNTNYSHGMWAHNLGVRDYQDLIDRGWRRSGKYCYKPTMNVTCCPMYTIKCAALNFKLSKSQKKVLKKVNKFLINGKKPVSANPNLGSPDRECNDIYDICDIPETAMQKFSSKAKESLDQKCVEEGSKQNDINKDEKKRDPCVLGRTLSASPMETSVQSPSSTLLPQSIKKGLGADPSRPPCKKAKEIRQDKKLQKLMQRAAQGKISSDKIQELMISKKKSPESKSLEDLLSEADVDNAAHRLRLKLVRSDVREDRIEEVLRVYQAYQATVHNDLPEKCSRKQFTRFLVKGPFKEDAGCSPHGFGSFHQQYWLNDKLIAVGVIDILPSCVSSVYLFYDPAYSFLSLGTYAAIREIALTRELNKHCPDLQYYYMGFYIHSCPKMKYKAHFSPSSLLCPETFLWVPYEKCTPKLDASKYSRLCDDPSIVDNNGEVDMTRILILHNQTIKRYPAYAQYTSNDDAEEVTQYASLVGATCYRRMLLFRK